MKLSRSLAVALFLGALSATAFADSLKYDGFKYSDDVLVTGLKNGQLAATIKDNEKLMDLDKVEWIELSNQPNFNKAEQNRKDAKKAAALYKAAIPNINDKNLKLLAQLRSVTPLDADGKYSEAMTNFLDAYAASPTDAVWKLHPATIPAAGSIMLKESAERIASKLPSFKGEDAKKNLKTLELELLTKANDPRAATLARELGGTGGDTTATPAPGSTPAKADTAQTPAEAVVSGGGVDTVVSAVRAKNYDAAITQADAQLKSATGPTAVQLFQLKAQALEAQKKMDEAAATLLRISTHYPSSDQAPQALLKAAEIEKSLKHDDAAKRLFREVVEKYPNSAAAVRAKPQV